MHASKSLVRLSALAAGAFFGIQIAIPCSLIAPSETGASRGVVGDRPLLVSENDAPILMGPSGIYALDPATPDPRIVAAKGGNGGELSFFVPRDPLPPGPYTFDDGRVIFTVTASAADVVPALGSSGKLEIFIHDSADGGCFGLGGVSSCGDTSSVVITAAGASMDSMYLLELTTAEGHAFSRLVSDRSQTGRFLFYGAFQEIGELDVETCAEITGVSPGGVLGSTLDLGCAKPN